MTKSELVSLLNSDIRNEYMHMHFYLHSAMMVQGLHREEWREFFLEEAGNEMKHVQEFGDLIIGLDGTPEVTPNQFPTNLTDLKSILNYAINMEEQVVSNYVTRMDQASELGGVDGRWMEIFLEDQIMKSRKDVDHLRQVLRGA